MKENHCDAVGHSVVVCGICVSWAAVVAELGAGRTLLTGAGLGGEAEGRAVTGAEPINPGEGASVEGASAAAVMSMKPEATKLERMTRMLA